MNDVVQTTTRTGNWEMVNYVLLETEFYDSVCIHLFHFRFSYQIFNSPDERIIYYNYISAWETESVLNKSNYYNIRTTG